MHLSRPSRLGTLCKELPFEFDDFGAAAQTFVRWRKDGHTSDRRVVDIWSYCYTLQYFHSKFARERTGGVSDFDAAVDQAYGRITGSLASVRDPNRFPQFVSVVCKNVLLSHRARRRTTVEVDENTVTVVQDEAQAYDQMLVRRVLERSIDAMPESIRDIGRMRLLQGQSYKDIAEATGRPVASVRTYVSKVKARLRDDPDVRALYDDGPAPAD